jgi:ribosome maturation factor RimP
LEKVLPAVQELCEKTGRWMGIEIVDVEIIRGNRGWVLRIYIDKAGGVTVDDCAVFSRQLDPVLDAEGFFPEQAYMLEVSSPGLTRPLKKRGDYARFRGKMAKIKTTEKIDGKNVFHGIIKGEKEGIVTVQMKEEDIHIPFEMIKKANLEFEG